MKNKRFRIIIMGIIATVLIPIVYQYVGIEGSITLAVITAIGSLILAYVTGQSYTDKSKYEGIYNSDRNEF